MKTPLIKLVVSLIISITCSTCAFAELKINTEEPVVIGMDIVVSSDIMSKEIPIRVFLPDSFHLSSPAHTYPVLFIEGSHGHQFFHSVTGIVKHLASVERMPETIVVAIDGDSPSPSVYHNNMWGSQSEGVWESWGKPQKYQQFLKQELFPYLKRQYRAAESRTVIGISGSSFFPFYSLLSGDNLFHHYVFIAAADVIGMGFSKEHTIKEELITLFKNNRSKAGVLFAVADSDINKEEHYKRNVETLKHAMKSGNIDTFVSKVYADEGHYDVLLKTLLDAIEIQYPMGRWSARYRDIVAQEGNALNNLDEHFQSLSEQYGFDIFPRANRWNSVNRLGFISRHLSQNDRTEEAIEVAKRYTEYHPTSWLAFETLGKRQLENKDISSAKRSFEKAIELAKDAPAEQIRLQKQIQAIINED